MHQKGGVGKSTLAFNIANNLKKNAKICILDVDYQGSLYETRSLSEIDTYHISELEKAESLNYDFAFIDTPPYLFDNSEYIVQISDLIVIPVKAGIYDTLSIKRTVDQIISFKAENKALIVFNMVKPKTNITDDVRSEIEDFGIPVSSNIISDLVAFTRSSITNSVEGSRTAQNQLDQLTQEILTKTLILK